MRIHSCPALARFFLFCLCLDIVAGTFIENAILWMIAVVVIAVIGAELFYPFANGRRLR